MYAAAEQGLKYSTPANNTEEGWVMLDAEPSDKLSNCILSSSTSSTTNKSAVEQKRAEALYASQKLKNLFYEQFNKVCLVYDDLEDNYNTENIINQLKKIQQSINNNSNKVHPIDKKNLNTILQYLNGKKASNNDNKMVDILSNLYGKHQNRLSRLIDWMILTIEIKNKKKHAATTDDSILTLIAHACFMTQLLCGDKSHEIWFYLADMLGLMSPQS